MSGRGKSESEQVWGISGVEGERKRQGRGQLHLHALADADDDVVEAADRLPWRIYADAANAANAGQHQALDLAHSVEHLESVEEVHPLRGICKLEYRLVD